MSWLGIERGRSASRTRTRRRLRTTPVRRARLSRFWRRRSATWLPTVPSPSSPTLSCTPVFSRFVGLLLREEDVERVIDMDAVIGAVRAAMIEFGEGVAQNEPRRRVYPPGGVLNVMFASHPGCGHYGLKTYSIGGGRARFLVILYAIEGDRAGSVEALIEADLLGAYRTRAATGVAAAALAPTGPVEVALIGTGFQARTQALALSRAIPVTEFRVFSRNAAHKEAFAQEGRERLKVAAVARQTAARAGVG